VVSIGFNVKSVINGNSILKWGMKVKEGYVCGSERIIRI